MAHEPAPGEPWILNDPYAGGTHLPDLTIVTRTELGYAVTRAHHADVGGSEPGSLPPGSRTLDEEGGHPSDEARRATLESLVSRMRNPDERRGDLRAQLAGNRLAETRIAELCARRGRARVTAAMDELLAYSERVVRAAIRELPDGRFEGARPARDAARPAGHPSGRDRLGRLDRYRLRRHRASVRGQPELPARSHALGVLLRRALPHRPRPAGVGRRLHARHRARARGLARQRAPAGCRRRPGTRRRRAASPTSSSTRSPA